MEWVQIFELAASVATTIGVFMVVWQLWMTKRAEVTQFEDSLAGEYRAITKDLPIEALLGEKLDDIEYAQSLNAFYYYFDLSNEQIFLRQHRRVRKTTWTDWADGIQSNLDRPAFRRAWDEIKQRSDGSFKELRLLEASGFTLDPRSRKWKQQLKSVP